MNTRERFARNNNMIAAYNNGTPVTDIAAHHDVTTATVYGVLRDARSEGVEIAPRHKGGRKVSLSERNSDIVARYTAGATLETIGREYEISRERVRQIVKKAGVGTYGRSVAARRRWEAEHGDTINATFTRTRSVAATINAHPDVPAVWIKRLLRPRSHESVHARATAPKIWSDTEIFAALNAAATDGIVTTTTYARWRRNGGNIDGRTPPTSTLITWRFGSWRTAVERAGLQIGRTSRNNYARTWTRDDALHAVSQFVIDAHARGIRPTYARYDAWVIDNPGNPSGAYLRHLTGNSWSEILMEALDTTAAA
jgi:transposase